MPDIYYVEDDDAISSIVKEYLEQRGYRVSVMHTITESRKALEYKLPSMILIDWNMPDGNGDTLCRWIRSKWENLPIIFLTVRDDSRDIVAGFQNGADDYVVKPFELDVLYSRMQALFRRAGNLETEYLSCDHISIDLKRTTVFYDQEEIPLSPMEYQLLCYLMKHKGITLTRENLLSYVWDFAGSYVNDNTLTVTMKRLREKLRRPACIKTVRSIGYRMEDTL